MYNIYDKFNIKRVDSETLIFKDGVFCEDISFYKNIIIKDNNINIQKKHSKPIHIIYIGNIDKENILNIKINCAETNVIFSSKLEIKKPAILDINIKNTGKNSVFNGNIICKNNSNFKLNIKAEHIKENTSVFVKTKILSLNKSVTDLTGIAKINKNCINCDSDISFYVMAQEKAIIKMIPVQNIKSVPNSANHSASLYKTDKYQIEYLKNSGFSDIKIKQILKEAFLTEI